MTELGQTEKNSVRAKVFRVTLKADIAQCGRHVRFVPIGDIAVSCFVHRVRRGFPVQTQSASYTKLSYHRAWPAPCAFTRNYLAAGFAQGFTLLWIGRSNLRLSEWICAVHYPVGIQSIDLGVR
jgi:hypothetical protein